MGTEWFQSLLNSFHCGDGKEEEETVTKVCMRKPTQFGTTCELRADCSWSIGPDVDDELLENADAEDDERLQVASQQSTYWVRLTFTNVRQKTRRKKVKY